MKKPAASAPPPAATAGLAPRPGPAPKVAGAFNKQNASGFSTASSKSICHYVALFPAFLSIIFFGWSMGALSAPSADDYASAISKLTASAYKTLTVTSAGDSGSATLVSDFRLLAVSQVMAYAGDAGTITLNSYVNYAKGCDVTGTMVAIGADSSGFADFCEHFADQCRSSGKFAGAMFVLCFLVSIVIFVIQASRAFAKNTETLKVAAMALSMLTWFMSISGIVAFQMRCTGAYRDWLIQSNSVNIIVPMPRAYMWMAILGCSNAVTQFLVNCMCTPQVEDGPVKPVAAGGSTTTVDITLVDDIPVGPAVATAA